MRFGSAWNIRLIFFHEIWKCLNIIHRPVTWWLCNLWPLATGDLCIKYTVGTQTVLQNFLQIYQAGHAQACTHEERRSKHLHGAATLPTHVDKCSYFRMRGPVGLVSAMTCFSTLVISLASPGLARLSESNTCEQSFLMMMEIMMKSWWSAHTNINVPIVATRIKQRLTFEKNHLSIIMTSELWEESVFRSAKKKKHARARANDTHTNAHTLMRWNTLFV